MVLKINLSLFHMIRLKKFLIHNVCFVCVPCQLKCGACGAIGHMRTNKECPQFSIKGGGCADSPVPSKKSIPVAMTSFEQEKMEEETDPSMTDKDLINVDGTKVKISKSLIQQ